MWQFEGVITCSALDIFVIGFDVLSLKGLFYYVWTGRSVFGRGVEDSNEDLFTIGLGWLLFGGLPFDLMNVLGQSLGFLGSCLYAYCKLKGK
ncbi:hypothetical protein Golax_020668 [Gossypium laxum]|uniref:Uncharacterized protein n=2 Tax=Gossypium TaxID=3633 RepID=A0A7J8MID0_9ROSI|nr:hypothetical protein [Gossypium lobatum]MBA0731045.1 hypothetical protein [Gossypium laxum]